jgi:hypothetical protein
MSDDHDYAEQLAEIQRSAWDSSRRASQAAEELAQRLAAELFAAQGDDAMSKAMLARSRYQRDLADVSYEFWRETAERRREAFAISEAAQAEGAAAAYTAFLEQIDQAIADVAASESGSESTGAQPNAQPKGKGRSTATRTPLRSASAEK